MSNIGNISNIGNMSNTKKPKNILTMIFITVACAVCLTSCSTYSSKFNCADGIGLPCEMLRSVDKKIDSGEIDKVYKAECKGKNCKKAQRLDEAVVPKTGPIKAKASIPEMIDDVVITEESGIEEK